MSVGENDNLQENELGVPYENFQARIEEYLKQNSLKVR